MPSDIGLYLNYPEKYDQLQNLRPDYKGAIESVVFLTLKYLTGKDKINVADFCGGVGNVTKEIANKIIISKATIVDTNKKFLDIARSSNIKAENLELLHWDILDVKLVAKEFDLVLSVFAYHHVPDDKKEKYLKIAYDALKQDGLFILAEIYVQDKENTNEYYKKLLGEIPDKNPLLERFILETASSSDFEFKVSKKFADEQLKSIGLKELESIKIWPMDDAFNKNIGTFVQIFAK